MARLALPSEQEVRGGGAALAVILALSTLLKLALLVPAHQTVPVGDARARPNVAVRWWLVCPTFRERSPPLMF